MASAVAFLRGEAGHWLTTSKRYSRKRISDLAGIVASEMTMTANLSVRFRDTRAGPHIRSKGADKHRQERT